MSEPINEFLLWNSCNNNCAFCHQKANRDKYPGKFPDDTGKCVSLKLVKDFLNSGKVADGSHILFMGGELFDTQLSEKTEREFLGLANMVAERMQQGRTGLLYLNSNLIYQNTSLLQRFLDAFAGMEGRLRFTTSYDVAYRYRTPQDRKTVQLNMKFISSRYPAMPRVANCIMTDKACEYLLEHPEYVEQFYAEYSFALNLIPYIRLHDTMAATRAQVLSLFMKLNELGTSFVTSYVRNLSVPQERILWEFNGDTFVYASSGNAACGHNENFRRVYKDDNRCFICDCLNLEKIL